MKRESYAPGRVVHFSTPIIGTYLKPIDINAIPAEFIFKSLY